MKNAHPDVLDGTLLAVKSNAIRMMLVSAYTFGDSLATCQAKKIAEVVMSAGDYVIASSGNNRTLTVAAKSVASTAAVPELDAGTATGGSTTTLANTAKAWAVNGFANKVVTIVSGTGASQKAIITSNTATGLVFPALATALDATSVYRINENLHIVHHDNVARVLIVTDETNDSPAAVGDTCNFPSHVYTSQQPT